MTVAVKRRCQVPRNQRSSQQLQRGSVPGTDLPRLGAHMSVAGGFSRAIERGEQVGCQTIQIFTKSNNQWAAPPITEEQKQLFRQAASSSGVSPVFSHCAYLINAGSPDSQIYKKSKQGLLVEMERATALGLAFLVLHPGAQMDSGETRCLKQIADTVAWVIKKTPRSPVKLLYENSAGQGTMVGHSFKQLKTLLKLTGEPKRTGICLDTCHLFAAGYDLRTKAAYQRTMAELDRVVGLRRVEVIHLNDSKRELGSHVDRHEHIGRGQIGLMGFRCLMNDKRLRHIPMVLETPKDEVGTEDKMNLKILRGLLRNG